ncbi:hypothetical protein HDU97_007308 [Phlyctochytrium planicorne]|nr:hypothetical protein HDU97_007308 [Phlyctochytrium planicorne]
MIANTLIAATVALLFCSQIATAHGHGIKKIVMFGDSASDTGRAYKLTKDNGPAIPSSLYWQNRFSNGPVWIELITTSKNITLDNHAIGGATTSDKLVQGWLGNKFGEPLRSNGSIIHVPGLDTQINQYLSYPELTPKDQILYTLWSCANDHIDNDILKLNKTGDFYAKAQWDLWVQLSNAGAKNIMVVVPPPKSLFDIQYALELHLLAAEFQLSHWSVKFGLFELPLTFVKIVAGASLYGFKGGLDAVCCTDCFSGPGVGKVCEDPESVIVWDGVHPSAKAHRIIAEDAANFIQARWGF